ncbi:MAG: NUDIX hydrolase [Minisyncoccia bacterium]
MKGTLYKILLPFAQMYWKLFRPATFGVKAVIVQRGNAHEILLVRHTYGDVLLWNLPGGGYNPKKESAIHALQRELGEELGLTPLTVEALGEYYTEAEGKKDTVKIFLAVVDNAKPGNKRDGEIGHIRWFSVDDIPSLKNAARIVQTAVRQYEGRP